MMTDDEKRYKELREKLCPPMPDLDEKDITIAHARSAFNSLIWDYVMDMILYLKWINDPDDSEIKGWISIRDPDRTRKHAIQSANIIWKRIHADDSDEMEDWDRIDPDFRKYMLSALSESHGGDCTAVACSCMRCHAEGIFKLPYTANWDKHEGYRMEQELSDLHKKLNK